MGLLNNEEQSLETLHHPFSQDDLYEQKKEG